MEGGYKFIMDAETDSIHFRKIMKENGEYLIRLAFYYVKNWSTAEDIVQDVFITFYQKSDQFENRSSVRTYLARITVNKCHDYLRSWKHKIQLYSNLIFAQSASNKNSPEHLVMNKDKNNRLIKEILEMPIKYREVILLYYYQEFSILEISKILNCSENTVKTRLSRARSILKSKFEGIEWEVILNEQH